MKSSADLDGVAERPITRSFKPRRRGLSPARAASYAESMRRWGLAAHGAMLSLPAVFAAESGDAPGPFVLDIGFGNGESLIELATARPTECVLGVEVHTTGLALVLEAVARNSLDSVRVVDGDAIELLDRLAPRSLDVVRIWFPDPWPKQKQRHRRIVRPDVIGALVDRLRIGGELHLATDIADYAAQMQQVCAGDGRLRGGIVPRPVWRPVTRFEGRGAAQGRSAIDLIYVRNRVGGVR